MATLTKTFVYNAYNSEKEKKADVQTSALSLNLTLFKYPYLLFRAKMQIIVVKIDKISARSIEYQMPLMSKKMGRIITPRA